MSAATPITRTQVAVAVLTRADETFLLASRPPGKPYAGYWEFPGGKVEPGETVHAALVRELHEELGIEVDPCHTVDYALLRLSSRTRYLVIFSRQRLAR